MSLPPPPPLPPPEHLLHLLSLPTTPSTIREIANILIHAHPFHYPLLARILKTHYTASPPFTALIQYPDIPEWYLHTFYIPPTTQKIITAMQIPQTNIARIHLCARLVNATTAMLENGIEQYLISHPECLKNQGNLEQRVDYAMCSVIPYVRMHKHYEPAVEPLYEHYNLQHTILIDNTAFPTTSEASSSVNTPFPHLTRALYQHDRAIAIVCNNADYDTHELLQVYPMKRRHLYLTPLTEISTLCKELVPDGPGNFKEILGPIGLAEKDDEIIVIEHYDRLGQVKIHINNLIKNSKARWILMVEPSKANDLNPAWFKIPLSSPEISVELQQTKSLLEGLKFGGRGVQMRDIRLYEKHRNIEYLISHLPTELRLQVIESMMPGKSIRQGISISEHPDTFEVGDVRLPRRSNILRRHETTASYAFTEQAKDTLYKLALNIRDRYPVLLVGETGTGKTTAIQKIADMCGHILNVVNLSQGSDAADLSGGYRPMDIRQYLTPTMITFEALFKSTFSLEKNEKFWNTWQRVWVKGEWESVHRVWQAGIEMALGRVAGKKKKYLEQNVIDQWTHFETSILSTRSALKQKILLGFQKGPLEKAMEEGSWLLLDEINLASSDLLELITPVLLSHSSNCHPDFRLFAAMNPAGDAGKTDLPKSIRARFSEIWVDQPDGGEALLHIVQSYLPPVSALETAVIAEICTVYTNLKSAKDLFDGAGRRPLYSLRTLIRCLRFVCETKSILGIRNAVREGFEMAFTTMLEISSKNTVFELLSRHFGKRQKMKVIGGVKVSDFWLSRFTPETVADSKYIITPSVEENLRSLARPLLMRRSYSILLQGPTSAGKTSLIEYLASVLGQKVVRINNHQHTDLAEYIGQYEATKTGFAFQDGLLITAMRKGWWVILDELNLAPSEVLEALNRLLDDNRELLIPETAEVVRPLDNFLLFATQNPSGQYGGRKELSKAFRNRFLEVHFSDIPLQELEIILSGRCESPPSYCKAIAEMYRQLTTLRASERVFLGKEGMVTLRDMFRWANRQSDSWETLAQDGYLLLSERCRNQEERKSIQHVIERVTRKQIDAQSLYENVWASVSQLPSVKKSKLWSSTIWTHQMKRLFAVVWKALEKDEPVLLVGDTGIGKTTVCQLISEVLNEQSDGTNLLIVNCHANTEASDLIGGVRPSRDATSSGADFAFFDGPLLQAVMNGNCFLLDEISLADDSVLERFNSLLETHRTLGVPEKDGAFFVAKKGFQFLATMNPAGDYGKKELSPALRNRFTEIWTDNIHSQADYILIIKTRLGQDAQETFIKIAFPFLDWCQIVRNSSKPIYNIRDILSWITFVNRTVETGILTMEHAIKQGALLTFLDGMDYSQLNPVLREEGLKLLATPEVDLSADTSSSDQIDILTREDMVRIGPFHLSIGTCAPSQDISFFAAETTRLNALRLARALVLGERAILLEGSPGCGKTALVAQLASTCGQQLTRINFSDQTDLNDLFGSDMPVESESAQKFAWKEGPFLTAMKNGEWVLLDELNLASQTVLEGLNACLDHRGVVFIPELAREFARHPNFRIFAAQNPLGEGGGRKGLPKSFLNRFTKVAMRNLNRSDMLTIAQLKYAEFPQSIFEQLIEFITRLDKLINNENRFGHVGRPWEFNLRDVFRVAEISLRLQDEPTLKVVSSAVNTVLVSRMRTPLDQKLVTEEWARISAYTIEKERLQWHITPTSVNFNGVSTDIPLSSGASISADQTFHPSMLPLQNHLNIAVAMALPCIITGPSGSGKCSAVRLFSQLCNRRLHVVPFDFASDTSDLIGYHQQIDTAKIVANEAARFVNEFKSLWYNDLQYHGEDNLIHYVRVLEMLESMQLQPVAHAALLGEMTRICEAVSRKDFKDIVQTFIATIQALYSRKQQFVWTDGPIVEAVRNGDWILLQNVNNCSSSVLDRLNCLLEPNGFLLLNEKGGTDGTFEVLKPHSNFRIFMTYDPISGEVSRAMRNRCLEYHVPISQPGADIAEFGITPVGELINENSTLFILASQTPNASLGAPGKQNGLILSALSSLHDRELYARQALLQSNLPGEIMVQCYDMTKKIPTALNDMTYHTQFSLLIEMKRIQCTATMPYGFAAAYAAILDQLCSHSAMRTSIDAVSAINSILLYVCNVDNAEAQAYCMKSTARLIREFSDRHHKNTDLSNVIKNLPEIAGVCDESLFQVLWNKTCSGWMMHPLLRPLSIRLETFLSTMKDNWHKHHIQMKLEIVDMLCSLNESHLLECAEDEVIKLATKMDSCLSLWIFQMCTSNSDNTAAQGVQLNGILRSDLALMRDVITTKSLSEKLVETHITDLAASTLPPSSVFVYEKARTADVTFWTEVIETLEHERLKNGQLPTHNQTHFWRSELARIYTSNEFWHLINDLRSLPTEKLSSFQHLLSSLQDWVSIQERPIKADELIESEYCLLWNALESVRSNEISQWATPRSCADVKNVLSQVKASGIEFVFHLYKLALSAISFDSRGRVTLADVTKAWMIFSMSVLREMTRKAAQDPIKEIEFDVAIYSSRSHFLKDSIATQVLCERLHTGGDDNAHIAATRDVLTANEKTEQETTRKLIPRPSAAKTIDLEAVFTHIRDQLPGLELLLKQDASEMNIEQLALCHSSLRDVEARILNDLSSCSDLAEPLLLNIRRLNHAISLSALQLRQAKQEIKGMSLVSAQSLLQFPPIQNEDMSELANICPDEELTSLPEEKQVETFRLLEVILWRHVVLENRMPASLRNFAKIDIIWKKMFIIYEHRRITAQKLESSKQSLYSTKAEDNFVLEQTEDAFTNILQIYNENPLENTGVSSRIEVIAKPSYTDFLNIADLHEEILNETTTDEPSIAIHSAQANLGLVCHWRQGFEDQLFSSPNMNLARMLVREKASSMGNTCPAKYNFYKDAYPAESLALQPVVEKAIIAIKALLSGAPEDQFLETIMHVMSSMLEFNMSTPIPRFLNSLDFLDRKFEEWQEQMPNVAVLDKIALELNVFTIRWRQLEIKHWNDLLQAVDQEYENRAKHFWPDLYGALIVPYLDTLTGNGDDLLLQIYRTLQDFLLKSPIGEFEPRVAILRNFLLHVKQKQYHCKLESEHKWQRLRSMLEQFLQYHALFTTSVSEYIEAQTAPTKKGLTDFSRIATWKDTNYFARKQSIDKNVRQLHKFVKQYKLILDTPVSSLTHLGKNLKREADMPMQDYEVVLRAQYDTLRNESPAGNLDAYAFEAYFVHALDLEELTQSLISRSMELQNVNDSDKANIQKQIKRTSFAAMLKALAEIGISVVSEDKVAILQDPLRLFADADIDLTSAIRQQADTQLGTSYQTDCYFYRILLRFSQVMSDARMTEKLQGSEVGSIRKYSNAALYAAFVRRRKLAQMIICGNLYQQLLGIIDKYDSLCMASSAEIRFYGDCRKQLLYFSSVLHQTTLVANTSPNLARLASSFDTLVDSSERIWARSVEYLGATYWSKADCQAMREICDEVFLLKPNITSCMESDSLFVDHLQHILASIGQDWCHDSSVSFEPPKADTTLTDRLHMFARMATERIQDFDNVMNTKPNLSTIHEAEEFSYRLSNALQADEIQQEVIAILDLTRAHHVSSEDLATFIQTTKAVDHRQKLMIQIASANHKALGKLIYVMLNIFLHISQAGLGTPPESKEDEQRSDDTPLDGTGLDDGQGSKDISDQIQDEDELEELQKNEQQEQQEEQQTLENRKEGAVEAPENFDGLSGEEDDDQDIDEDDLDDEAGQVDQDQANHEEKQEEADKEENQKVDPNIQNQLEESNDDKQVDQELEEKESNEQAEPQADAVGDVDNADGVRSDDEEIVDQENDKGKDDKELNETIEDSEGSEVDDQDDIAEDISIDGEAEEDENGSTVEGEGQEADANGEGEEEVEGESENEGEYNGPQLNQKQSEVQQHGVEGGEDQIVNESLELQGVQNQQTAAADSKGNLPSRAHQSDAAQPFDMAAEIQKWQDKLDILENMQLPRSSIENTNALSKTKASQLEAFGDMEQDHEEVDANDAEFEPIRAREDSVDVKIEALTADVETLLKTPRLDDTTIIDMNSALEKMLESDLENTDPAEVWAMYGHLTQHLSVELCEALRLILEPTQATKLQGGFKTGKRLNLRKIISYIASDYRQDKIWLRRTRPSARQYQILLCVDDSESMSESKSMHLAYTSLSMLSKALISLEAGDISVVKFGTTVETLHDFGQSFDQTAGGHVLKRMRFNQKDTDLAQLLEKNCESLRNARRISKGAEDLWQLQLIISDGICQDHARLKTLVADALEDRIMTIFIVLDNHKGGEQSSILDLTSVEVVDDQVQTRKYMDTFPFEYYVVLEDITTLPTILCTVIKQWFDRVANI